MAHPRAVDLLHLHANLQQRVRKLEITPIPEATAGGEQVESFIMDPVTVRAWPAALASKVTLTGVMAYLGSGGPVTVRFMCRSSGSTITLHTFTSFSAGTVRYATGGSWAYGWPIDLDVGDLYWPEITAGSGSNITAAFITEPSPPA